MLLYICTMAKEMVDERVEVILKALAKYNKISVREYISRISRGIKL